MPVSVKQLLQASCVLAAVAAGQWQDLSGYGDDIIGAPSIKKDVPVSKQKTNCFQVSQIKGRTDFQTSFQSDFSKLKKSYYHGMALTKIRLCGTNSKFNGIQGFHKDESRFLTLSMIGEAKTCKDITIPSEAYINRVQITYDSSGINYFKATTDTGITMTRGQPKSFDKEYVAEFQKYQPLAGFVGYELNGITALGFYRYMCDVAPPPEPEDEKPEGGNGGNGEGNGGNGGGSQENGGTGENTGGGGNGGGDITDPNKPINGGGGANPDDPIDPDGNSRGDDTDQTPEVIQIQEEDSNSLTVILIILICVLIPLVAILGFVVYLFRKNKKNSVQTAMGRRRSSAALRKTYERQAQQDAEQAGLDADLDEKMEGKGKGKRHAVSIMPADDEKVPSIPSSEQAVMAMFTQVPTDDEIKELLKGKTAKEKRALLKEIEKAKQQKIHLEYLLEQQKIKHDERWAVRNVEERQALENLLNGGDASAASPILNQGNSAIVREEFKEERAASREQHQQNADNTGIDVTPIDSGLPPIGRISPTYKEKHFEQ